MPKSLRDKSYSFEHCAQRFKERYNRELTQELFENHCSKAKTAIELGRYSKKEVTSDTLQYIVQLGEIICVYAMKRECITTYLSPNKS